MENQIKNQTKTVSFYEGSYQFKQEKTQLNVSEDYLEMILAKQYEYRATKETLWAEVSTEESFERYTFTYGVGLNKVIKK